MIKKTLNFLLISLITLTLIGCSSSRLEKYNFVHQSETTYMRAQEAPPLRLPVGLNNASVGDDFPVAPISAQNTPHPGLIPPASLAAQVASGQVSSKQLKQMEKDVKALPNAVEDTTTAPAAANANKPAPNDGNVLILDQNTTQIWNRIGPSLKQAGYLVLNQNPQTKIYYLLDTPATDGRATKASQMYLLHLQDVGNNAQAYLTDTNNAPVKLDIAKRILTDLNDALHGKFPSPVMKFLKELF